MAQRRLVLGVLAGIVLLAVALLWGPELFIGLVGQSTVAGEDATVRVHDAASDETLATVAVDLATTTADRYTGLSNVDDLPEDHGMLFEFDEAAERTFVMREMSFGLDIIFIGADRRITAIHEAPAPGPGEDGEDQRYTGRGELVLEVNRGWATSHDITVGDRVAVEYHE